MSQKQGLEYEGLEQVSILSFQIGWEEFCIDLYDVKEIIQAGQVYIAPGDKHMEITIENKNPSIKIYKGTLVNFCMPSIDVLFFSAAKVYRNRAMGIILTGMGSDGVEGLGAIKRVGGKTIAESEEIFNTFV